VNHKTLNARRDLNLARRIDAAGVRIYIEEDDPEGSCVPPDGLLVYQRGGEADSSVFDFFGGTGVMMDLLITFNLPGFAISAFGLELPWTDEVTWLEDPRETGDRSDVYRFGRNVLEFDRSLVLNHSADVRLIRPRGSSIRGYLLGTAAEPVPDQFRHGTMIPAFVVVFDQFGNRHRSAISLWSDRSQSRLRHSGVKPKRGGLFDHPDPVFHQPGAEDDQNLGK